MSWQFDDIPQGKCEQFGKCAMDEDGCPFFAEHAAKVARLVDNSLWHSGTPGCGPGAVILTCPGCITLRNLAVGGA